MFKTYKRKFLVFLIAALFFIFNMGAEAKPLKLDESIVLRLEEFWKTDWIFRANTEREKYKSTLDFYKK